MINVSEKVVEKIKTHSLYLTTLFRKSCRLWDNLEKYCWAGHATDDSMAHEHFMLNTWDYKYTLRLCNTYCFSTATMVARMRINVALYVRCLSCLYLSSSDWKPESIFVRPPCCSCTVYRFVRLTVKKDAHFPRSIVIHYFKSLK